MKKTLTLFLTLILLISVDLLAQVRPFTPRYTNPSVRGDIKYVSNNIITTVGTTTSETPPGGTATNSGVGANIDIDNISSTIIPWNSTWKFSDSGYAPGSGTWINPAYSDGGWVTATAGLPTDALRDIGYGDGDQVTPYIYAGCGARPAVASPGCTNKYWTTYFRKQFNIASLAGLTGFQINMHRDDGAVIYINGVEVARSNMPTGAIVYSTPATTAMEGPNEDVTINLGLANFVAGTNTIAVEIHQSAQNSTDLSFRLELLGINDNGTYNSSSSNLNLASCSEVLWAGLYWGVSLGNSNNTTWRVGYNDILFKVPGSPAYATVTSTQTELHENGVGSNHNGYTCFANVTSLINALNANGTYTAANVVSPVSTGLGNQAGGWTLVVVYKNDIEIPRNLVVFDGFQIVQPGDQKDIPIAGFLTPLTGPVSCELGAVCYDGDRVSSDGFFFKQDSAALVGTYTDLSNIGTSGNQDTWNSTISYFGANVTTRNPSHANTLGYDADIIQLPNGGNAILGNNKTSARIRISSPSSGGENFFLHVVTSAISTANPSFNLVKSSTDLSGGVWQTGDSLRYKLVNRNNGTDTSVQSVIIDTLSALVTYKPGTLYINNVLKTDAPGDDEAEYDPIGHRVIFRIGTGATAIAGGQIIPNKADSVMFTVNATTICQLLACNNIASNQGRIDYLGKNSGQSLNDYSGYIDLSGCFVIGAITNTITGTCGSRGDTTLVNPCPILSVTLPHALYPGYTFYSGLPFVAGNVFNPATPITSAHTYYAYLNPGGLCADTIRFIVLLQPCPDIDDDDDGIPDYVESNGADAFGDNDVDGIPNFTDPSYPGYSDANGDGVNDNFDTDRDGVPNQLDRDSDNDGIPDVVEAGGVDQNGDGRIDNFTDTDNDGLSQNVDANNTGQPGSGNGLGLPDLDGDGIPNFIDLDSDNDGIPDVREAGGTDANNDGHIDSYSDTDADGFSDNVDGDVGNDGTAENSANAILLTGADINNNGTADSYPFDNMDGDMRANPYDLDSDNDGLTDVREAGFTDADSNGQSDGTKGTDGWDDTIDALASLVLRNTDGSGNPNYLDIDSDDDGIPDNVEGPSTSSYNFPAYADSDGDGIDNAYDNIVGFGGNGNTPNDQDSDSVPDYIDTDTDNDGMIDRIEGNDLNGNCLPDDIVSLLGVDTDGDGLDDRFDANNLSIKGTTAYMGNAGSLTGDPSPGSLSRVQRCLPVGSDRDWRLGSFVLDADFLSISGNRQGETVKINWVVSCNKIIDHFELERSTDGINFMKVHEQTGNGGICKLTPFNDADNIAAVFSDQVYYRVKAVSADGKSRLSRSVAIRLSHIQAFQVSPNPASSYVNISVTAERKAITSIKLMDATGRIVLKQFKEINKGYNSFSVEELGRLAQGVYTIQLTIDNKIYNEKILIRH